MKYMKNGKPTGMERIKRQCLLLCEEYDIIGKAKTLEIL